MKFRAASVSIEWSVVFFLAVVKLSIHLLTAGSYGLFVDELYFLACGQHLAWGYVDMPPLAALMGWLARLLFADSTAGIQVIPALAGAGLVLITGLLVKEFGGRWFAQLAAGISILIAGVFLVTSSYLSMNAIEPLIWLGSVMIALGMRVDVLRDMYRRVESVALVHHPYAMGYQNFPIYLCREPKQSLQDIWPSLKKWN
jgi:4-amino-4-deoxy-L-arabinose transferase-like glycosyltransferase